MAPRVRWLLLISVCLIAVVGSYWKWLAIEPRDDLLHHPTSPILDSGPLQIPMERQHESGFIQTLKLDNHSGLPASAANWVDTIYQLNQSNPSQAAQLLDSQDVESRGALTLSLIKNWSLKAPAAALDWYQTQQGELSESEYQLGMRALLMRYAHHSPQLVFYELRELVAEEYWSSIIPEVATGWAMLDPPEALAWLIELKNEDLDSAVIEDASVRVFIEYSKQQPENAALALTQFDDLNLALQLIPELAVNMANRELNSALDWVNLLQEPKVVEASIIAIADDWVYREPEIALDILNSHAQFFTKPSQRLEETYTRLVNKNAVQVMNNFDSIPALAQPNVLEALAQHAARHREFMPTYQAWLASISHVMP